MKTLLSLLALLTSPPAFAVDPAQVEKLLATSGCEGEVHGASPTQGLYVFNYRNPDDFFDYLEMSLVAEKPEVQAQLATLARHDRIRVKGAFLANRSPQKHIRVDSLEVVRKYVSPVPSDPYGHDAKLPDELLGKSSATFLVHALHADGQILVVEYKDTVVPIYVRNGDLTKDLFRGDLVQLAYRVAREPGRPTHLRLDEAQGAQAVRVLESIREKHGNPGVIQGALILFPKSPEIKFNVFAVQELLPEGLSRQYTLVNFESPEAFARIREMLQAAWDTYPNDYVNGRNKLVSRKLLVRATGVFNEIDPNQANPQILLKGPEDLQIISLP
jgi:hypothetical protein